MTVLREQAYPRALPIEDQQAVLDRIVGECRELLPGVRIERWGYSVLIEDETCFDVSQHRCVRGPATPIAEVVRNQLRRHGIRFRYEPTSEGYRPWA